MHESDLRHEPTAAGQEAPSSALPKGKVYIVGAGPGDPGLITVRGLSYLREADLVIVDCLVHPQLLTHIRPEAEVIQLADHPPAERTEEVPAGRPRALRSAQAVTLSPQEAIARMVAAAQAGKTVVRLKGGCPEVFGRQTEELEALRQAGLVYQIVPGITAGLAAAAYAEIPLTDADISSTVTFATGHERPGKQGLRTDFRALGQLGGTLVVYMEVGTASTWAAELLRGGCAPWTPVAVVCRASWPEQRIIRCQLGNLAETLARHDIPPPAVVIVGQSVARAPERSWFERRPLFGQRIVVTRPEEETDKLAEMLRELGAEVLPCPVIAISDPPDWGPVDEAIENLGQYHWILFTSANGVRYFFRRLLQKGKDLRQLGRAKLAAIGPGTAEALGRIFLRADLVPEEFRAEALADALLAVIGHERHQAKVLLVRANRGRPTLAESLTAAGVLVHQIAVYTSADISQADPTVDEALTQGQIDWVTVTSSSIARSLVRMFGEKLRNTKLASISPVTSATLRDLGFEPAAEGTRYTFAGLVEAILLYRG